MNENISLKRILTFFLIAITISNIFRLDLFNFNPEIEQLPAWISILIKVLLQGSGVIIGALIVISLLRKKRTVKISLFGTSKSKSIVMTIIPIIILPVIGVKNDYGMNSHLYGFIAITSTLIYCILEEYGWRGYLQEELKSLKAWQKYFIIGLMWYLWHLTFLTKATVEDNLFFMGMMIFGSWGIGQVAGSTKSIMASACFHMIIQIMMFNPLIRNGINGTEKLIVLGISVIIWYVIIKKWEKDTTFSVLGSD